MKIKTFLSALALCMSVYGYAQDGPISYKELQAKFPAKVNGYSPQGEKDGSTLNMSGIHFSTAEWTYAKGDAELNVMFFDYKGSDMMYQQVFSMWNSDLHYESDDEEIKGTKINGFPALVTFSKAERTTNVTVGLYDRYIITVDGNNVSKEEMLAFVKALPFDSFKK